MKNESKSTLILFSCLFLLVAIFYVSAGTAQVPQDSYLPILYKQSTLTPTSTPTSTQAPPPPPTATPTTTPPPAVTNTPTSTPTQPPHNTGYVVITYIFYDGVLPQEPDEYVEIRNDDSFAIQLANWTLRDDANHVYTFPSFVIQPGQVCRVYTNQYHPEWCGFNYGSGSPIWNNTGDCAYLRDSAFTLIYQYCY
jgi:hypothetical protein